VDGIEPGGATPLASAVSKVCDHVAKLPFPEHTVVLVMADGENTEPIPAAKAYQKAKTKVLLHTVGFAIEPGSASEKELTELAVLSGGTFARAGAAPR
jgi:Mg-chelatase subunit ChlD